MFKRGALSRSLHAPHGVNIKALDNNPRMKRKLSWSSPKVRGAASEGVLTHKPVLLKEGFLYKPGFFRIVGKIVCSINEVIELQIRLQNLKLDH